MIESLEGKKVLSAINVLKTQASSKETSDVKEGLDLASIATKLLRNREKKATKAK